MEEIIKKVKVLLEVMRTEGLEEVEVKEGDFSLKLRRKQNIPILSNSKEDKGAEAEEELYEIKSSTVGVFRFPQKGEKNIPEEGIKCGVRVRENSLLGIIEGIDEAHNEMVYATKQGILQEICVEENQVIGWGQTLFKIKVL